MAQGELLIVEDDAGLREALVDTLLLAGYKCNEVDSGEAALLLLNKQSFDLVVSDIQMGGMSGLSLLKSIKVKFPLLPVLLMTAYAKIDDAVSAIRDGAIDYLAKPFSPEVLLSQVSRYAPVNKVESCTPIFGDPSTEALLKMAEKVAKSDASVIISGPSGSGKEVLSRYIHDKSTRCDEKFVAINCGAIPDTMLESTLFGYEKGAFTGAIQACPGKFEQAQGGTILLDEITEMDLGLQAKLLRVLQEREVERLGGRKTIELDVRVLATSNRDLKEAVSENLFREDLYYRLNVFPLMWKPLAERPGDIIVLAEHLIERHCLKSKEPIALLTEGAKQKLLAHAWPGNVRELDNVIQRALILCDGNSIHQDDVFIEELLTVDIKPVATPPHNAPAYQEQPVDVNLDTVPQMSEQGNYKDELKDKEHRIILETLARCNGKRKEVAETLGISPRTLRYKLAQMRDLGIALPA